MMRLLAAAVMVLVVPVAGAQHTHGAGELEIAIEGKSAQVRLVASADDIYGFERAPRTDAERARREAALKTLREQGAAFLLFDAALGCTVKNMSVSDDVDPAEPGHREVVAQYEVTCRRDLVKSKLRVGVAGLFPKVTQLKATRLSEAGATTATLKRGDSLEL